MVDDEPGVRFGLREFLGERGFEVESAATGAEAEDTFRVKRPEALVLDHLLPDTDALKLLPRLREVDPTVPVIILTAHGTIDLAVRALQQGADHFLTKPVDLEALRVVLHRLIESRRLPD